jgi:toxin ParE1/3/4
MKDLIIAPAAPDDAHSIERNTIRKWSANQASRNLDKIYLGFEFIRTHPEHHSLRSDPYAGCCFLRVDSHISFFRSSGSKLEIVRVLHVSMDFQRHLSPLD